MVGRDSRLLVELTGSAGKLWLKLTFDRPYLEPNPLVTGYEVYARRPSRQYWQVGYNHHEPRLLTVTNNISFPLRGGVSFLALWVKMGNYSSNVRTVTGVEPVGVEPSDSLIVRHIASCPFRGLMLSD